MPDNRQNNATPAPPRRFALDAAGCVAEDLTCLKCGYNLRGLPAEGRCPECGTAVGRSAYGNFLQYCEPVWVERLASGMRCVWWGLAGVICMPVAAPLLMMTGWLTARNDEVISALCWVLWIIYGGVTLWLLVLGVWRLTTPDPIGETAEARTTPPVNVRVSLLLTLCAPAIGYTVAVIMRSARDPMSFPLVATGFALLILIPLLLSYLAPLAERGEDVQLSRSTRYAGTTWMLSAAVALILVAGRAILAATTGRRALQYFEIAPCFMTALFLICIVWSLRLTDRYFVLFRRCADTASRTWASTSVIPRGEEDAPPEARRPDC